MVGVSVPTVKRFLYKREREIGHKLSTDKQVGEFVWELWERRKIADLDSILAAWR